MRPFFAMLVAVCIPFAAFAVDKPNLVIINMDDMGYADIAPFGSKINRTPNLDKLAAEGRKLTCFYAAPVCSPSRAALMTGCYPKRCLPIVHVLFPEWGTGLNPSEITIAELLKQQGYTTACIGKWHLGDQPEFLPTRQGFDRYFGLPYSNDMGPGEDGVKSNFGDKLPEAKGKGQPPLPLMRQETVVKRVLAEDQTQLVEMYTKEAIQFMRDNKEKPFFLYLAHSAVHFPIYPGKAFQKKNAHGYYSDWVEESDWSVGQVMDAIRELGLGEKTFVFFTSDNGGTQRAKNTPLKGFKDSTWEGGMRVPAIAWWPGKIPAGTSCGEVCGMMDIMPTFVKIAGGEAPKDRTIDGADIWPLISGAEGAKTPHDTFYYYRGFKLEAVRSGPWKLHLAKTELYNLDSDIGEAANVAAANEDVVAKIKVLAEKMKDDLGLDGIGPGCRPLGKVDNPKPLIGYDGKVREGLEPKTP